MGKVGIEACKYFTPHLNTVKTLISTIYDIDGCSCGGMAHTLVDDNNFDDNTINRVLELCDEEEYQYREEKELVRLVCNELLKLTMQQRALIFKSYYHMIPCFNNCDKCSVEHGEMCKID
jgi:hypothetical protein